LIEKSHYSRCSEEDVKVGKGLFLDEFVLVQIRRLSLKDDERGCKNIEIQSG